MKRIIFFLMLCLMLSSCEIKDNEFNFSVIPGAHHGYISYWDMNDTISNNSWGEDWFNIHISAFEDHYKIHFDKIHNFQVPVLEFEIDYLNHPPTKGDAHINLYENDNYMLHWNESSDGSHENKFAIVKMPCTVFYSMIILNFELDSKDRINKHKLVFQVVRYFEHK